MDGSRLQGAQYVRLAAGVAERIAPYLGVAADEIEELVLELSPWPEQIRPLPLKGWDGRLIAGDPVLLDAGEKGLIFANGLGAARRDSVLVPWNDVSSVQVLSKVKRA